MTIEIRKAERTKSKLRLAISGPAGGGKTMSSLKLAKGIGGRVVMIDTERGSGDLYADLYDYDIISLEPPFKPDLLVEAIHAAEAAGYDVIIIDSLTHFWNAEGGLLDQADKMQAAGKNRFTLWADITPQHNRLVNAILNSSKHIVATMRSKQEYAMETDEKGKASVKKLGLAPIQRDGMEYEFTVFFDVDQNHNAKATKDRTNMFSNEVFMIDESIGQRILSWLNTGKTDVRSLKREIISALKDRLELGVPRDQSDAAQWVRMAIPRLTGFEWNEENIEKIAAALSKITDKHEAYRKVWESTPQTPPPAPEAPKVETPAPKPVEVEGGANNEPSAPTEEVPPGL